MICSARELGIGDDHAGIIVLARTLGRHAGRRTPGPIVGLDDIVVEVEITPDRGYQMSVRGLARELSPRVRRRVHRPGAGHGAQAAPTAPAWPVTVGRPGRLRPVRRPGWSRGVDPTAPTPEWMQRRLLTAGIRTLSLPIDVTNYVMLELGQPMHAFDADRLSGGARRAARPTPGEKLTTLDGVARVLDAEDMVISDDTGPISLAAVMGGETSRGGRRHDDRRAARGGALGPDDGRPHRPPAQAVQRGGQALGARRRPAAVAWSRSSARSQLLAEHGGGTARPSRSSTSNYPAPATADHAGPGDRPARLIGVRVPAERVGRAADRGRLRGRRSTATALDGHPAELAARPARPGRPGRGGRPARRLRRRAQRAAGRPARPRAHRRRSAAAARSGGRWPSTGYVEVLSYPFVVRRGRARAAARPARGERGPAGQPAVGGGAAAAHHACCRRCSPRCAATSAGASATSRCSSWAWSSCPPPGRARRRRMGVAGRPDAEEWAAGQRARAGTSRGTSPWCSPARSSRPAGGAPGRAADWADAVAGGARRARRRGRARDAGRGARPAAQAPWHPGRCAAIAVDGVVVGHAGELHPAVCADAGAAPAHLRDGARPGRGAAARRRPRRRRSRPSRRR